MNKKNCANEKKKLCKWIQILCTCTKFMCILLSEISELTQIDIIIKPQLLAILEIKEISLLLASYS